MKRKLVTKRAREIESQILNRSDYSSGHKMIAESLVACLGLLHNKVAKRRIVNKQTSCM